MTSTARDRRAVEAHLRLWCEDGRLWAGRGEQRWAVEPTRCFPWSEPDRFISLRDHEGAEVALVTALDELAPDAREALEQALREAGFVFEIVRICAVEEEVEIRTWTVRTTQGSRTFQTARDAWPRELPTGGYLIRDVAGDLYRVDDPEGLDATSRRYLWAFAE